MFHHRMIIHRKIVPSPQGNCPQSDKPHRTFHHRTIAHRTISIVHRTIVHRMINHSGCFIIGRLSTLSIFRPPALLLLQATCACQDSQQTFTSLQIQNLTHVALSLMTDEWNFPCSTPIQGYVPVFVLLLFHLTLLTQHKIQFT